MIRSDLHFFSTLAKSGSLTAAAREFNVTPSAVSKWLAQLEARLGVRLVTRTTRRLALTPEGEAYLVEGRRILAAIEDLEQGIASRRAAPIGLLKVNASLGFGRSIIAPALSDFARSYPDLEIRLLLSDRPLSLAEGEADMGIRFGPPPDARLVARKIADHRRRVVASPIYLRRHGRPPLPQDLTRHNCLIVRQDDAAYGQWHFSKGGRTETVKVSGTLSSNDGTTALNWALDGHGVLMRSEWDSAPYVRSGRLEVLFDDYTLSAADLYAVYPPSRNLAAKLRVFTDFLTARFAGGRGLEVETAALRAAR